MPDAPRVSDRTLRLALAFLLVVLGAGSVLSMAGEWVSGSHPVIFTGVAMPVAGIALAVGRDRALRVSQWALRIQLAITTLVIVLAIPVSWPDAGGSGVIPGGALLAWSGFHVLVVAGALVWVTRFRRSAGQIAGRA